MGGVLRESKSPGSLICSPRHSELFTSEVYSEKVFHKIKNAVILRQIQLYEGMNRVNINKIKGLRQKLPTFAQTAEWYMSVSTYSCYGH